MKLKYNFVMNKVADKTVAVAVGGDLAKYNGFIKMNDTGAFIFNLLKKDVTREDIVEAVKKEYDGDDNVITAEVDSFLEELNSAGIIN